MAFFIKGCSENNCRLPDGKYQVSYDKEFFGLSYEIKSDTIKEIHRDNYYITVVEWISDDEYFLSDLVSHITYKDDLNKELYTYGKPYYRLINCSKDTIYFKLMRNEHSAVNTGKLIKID